MVFLAIHAVKCYYVVWKTLAIILSSNTSAQVSIQTLKAPHLLAIKQNWWEWQLRVFSPVVRRAETTYMLLIWPHLPLRTFRCNISILARGQGTLKRFGIDYPCYLCRNNEPCRAHRRWMERANSWTRSMPKGCPNNRDRLAGMWTAVLGKTVLSGVFTTCLTGIVCMVCVISSWAFCRGLRNLQRIAWLTFWNGFAKVDLVGVKTLFQCWAADTNEYGLLVVVVRLVLAMRRSVDGDDGCKDVRAAPFSTLRTIFSSVTSS